MRLCLDVGNTHIFAGVFNQGQLTLRFRYNSQQGASSDQIGIFLRNALRENQLDPNAIEKIVICSVVPDVDYSLRSACKKYFDLTPYFLNADTPLDLTIGYHNPQEVGADRLANAIAAINQYPQQNLVVVDFGTATTLDAISQQKHYLGGAILPGIKLSMDALQKNTAKLMPVAIVTPEDVIGRNTSSSIQSGLYYGQISAIKFIAQKIHQAYFAKQPMKIIATGGFSHLFAEENFFDQIEPDLVLYGLNLI
jgi:type III pantothenate kinase